MKICKVLSIAIYFLQNYPRLSQFKMVYIYKYFICTYIYISKNFKFWPRLLRKILTLTNKVVGINYMLLAVNIRILSDIYESTRVLTFINRFSHTEYMAKN